MYAVIFRAEIHTLDDEYVAMAERLREIALNDYGCREFCSYTEGSNEVAISYWDAEQQIRAWKQNAEHLAAQEKGRSRWYKSYTVQVLEVLREYNSDG